MAWLMTITTIGATISKNQRLNIRQCLKKETNRHNVIRKIPVKLRTGSCFRMVTCEQKSQ